MIARVMIQRVCPKRDNRFVAIKWTAIPSTLLESERFRYEQGAITGAVAQTVGRSFKAEGREKDDPDIEVLNVAP